VKLRFAVLFYFMNDMRLAVVVLAAGEGTRMKSSLPKVLHQVCGWPMLGHVLAIADALDAAETVMVVAEETLDPIRQTFGNHYRYTTQAERLGTGHALLQARDLLLNAADDVLILFGDTPLFRSETARSLVASRRDHQALLALLSFRPNVPTGYGRVLRDSESHVTGLVEERDATPAQRLVGECNSGMMCIQAKWLWETLPQVPRSPIKGEYYLTDLVAMAVAAGGSGAVIAIEAADHQEALGVNDRVQLAQANRVMRQRILDILMRDGITVIDPDTTYVDAGVTIGRDTTLLPGTLLSGRTNVGASCMIGPYATLKDTLVGAGARVRYALLEGVTINPGADIEPFSHHIGERRSAE